MSFCNIVEFTKIPLGDLEKVLIYTNSQCRQISINRPLETSRLFIVEVHGVIVFRDRPIWLF